MRYVFHISSVILMKNVIVLEFTVYEIQRVHMSKSLINISQTSKLLKNQNNEWVQLLIVFRPTQNAFSRKNYINEPNVKCMSERCLVAVKKKFSSKNTEMVSLLTKAKPQTYAMMFTLNLNCTICDWYDAVIIVYSIPNRIARSASYLMVIG